MTFCLFREAAEGTVSGLYIGVKLCVLVSVHLRTRILKQALMHFSTDWLSAHTSLLFSASSESNKSVSNRL